MPGSEAFSGSAGKAGEERRSAGMGIKGTVYELGKDEAAEFITYFAPGGLAGAGFANLLIAGDLENGDKEILELRFKADFLPHIKRLGTELERLCEYEDARTREMLDAAQSLADGKLNDLKPFEKEISRANSSSDSAEDQTYADPGLAKDIEDALEEFQGPGEEDDYPGDEEDGMEFEF
mgnify:CR=1 FL=1